MKNIDKEVLALFKDIMLQCKRERKSKTKVTNKQLATKLGITENYISALESGRAVPSIPVLLKYFLIGGFDVSPLSNLEIKDKELLKSTSKLKSNLIQKIYTLDDEQLGYLAEQVKLAELFNLKIKSPKK